MSATGGWESWEWDETLFAGAAPYYERGRLPYAPGLSEAFADALGLDGRGRLLDVGCGPGTIARRLAHLFELVIGLDPDPGMLDEASRLSREGGITNTSWLQMRAENHPGDLGSFRVVTFAQSFHWMDRKKVASAVKSVLGKEGAVVHIDALSNSHAQQRSPSSQSLPHPPPPEATVLELRTRYLGPNRRAGRGIRNTSPSGEDEIFEAAGFLPAQIVIVPDGRLLNRTIDEIVANTFSSSSTAPHLFGDRLKGFEEDLRALLSKASPSGLFSVLLPDNRLRIFRPA